MSTPVIWTVITGLASSVILISPTSAAQCRSFVSTVLPSRPGIGERTVPWLSAARRGGVSALQRLDLGHQRGEQQRLEQPRVVREARAPPSGRPCPPELLPAQAVLRSSSGSSFWS